MEQKASHYYRKVLVFIFFQFLLILNMHHASGQNLKLAKISSEAYMYLKNKQLSEFIERFNYKADFKGNPIDSAFKKTYPRALYIKMLFNQKQFNATYFNTNDTLIEFLSEVCDKGHPLYIDRYSEEITAKCVCEIIYKGNRQNIVLYLNQEVLEDRSVKWVITKADRLQFLPLSENIKIPCNNNVVNFIPPSSNEVNFIHLKQLLKKNSNVFDLLNKNCEQKQLIYFLYMINKGDIIFSHVNELTYEIYTIPGYKLIVENFNRPDLNSGWLINGLKMNTETGDNE